MLLTFIKQIKNCLYGDFVFKLVLGVLGVGVCIYPIFLLSSQISRRQIIFTPELPIYLSLLFLK